MAAPSTDITGYRSDGGGLGQDQGVSKNLKGILTAKAPLLSAPGTVLENTLYYDINSSSVTAVEMQATYAKDRIVLNNFTMGSTPSAYIPSVLFAGTIFWQVELPDFYWPNGIENGNNFPDENNQCCIPHGWGFAALKSIIVYMGASSIAQIQISGMTNYLVNAATCETLGKRDLMVKRAGMYLNWNDKNSILAAPKSNAYMWREKYYGGFYTTDNPDLDVSANPVIKHAVVPLRLPFSSMAVLDKRLSMDTKLSTQPIQITLQTAQKNEFMYLGSLVSNLMGNLFKDSTLQLWQEELSDKSLSVRNELLAMPEFNVGYPFQYAQSIPFEVIATNDTGGNDYIFLMNITSIINSDLTTFLFNVTWDGRTNPEAGQLCPLYGEYLTDIELLLNGQRFFFFDRLSYEAVTLAKQLDDPCQNLYMPARNYTRDLDKLISAGFNARGHFYEFNNSRLRAIVAEDNLQNTARFTNQTFQLRFKINRSHYYLFPADANAQHQVLRYSWGFTNKAGYTLNMTYLYNAVFLIGGDGGTTKLITN